MAQTRTSRLAQLRQDVDLTLEEVGQAIGKSRQTVHRYETDSSAKIRRSVLEKIAEAYKTTVEYIETGRHPTASIPLNSGKANAFTDDVHAEGFLTDMVPVDIHHLDPKARAGFIELGAATGGGLDLSRLDTIRLYVSSHEEAARYKNALVFTVDGDSMEPLMHTGDRVIGWQVPEAKWEQVYNQVCVVAYDDTVTIKSIKENELFTRGLLTLRAHNPDAGYLSVRREQISSIWRVDEFFDRPKIRLT